MARAAAGILLGAFILSAAVAYRADLQAARTRVASGSTLAQTPCGPIEYARAGEGPAVLMVHGAGGGFDQSLAFARPLIEAGYSVIAPSRFGYLRTPMPPDASARAQAQAHVCLLDSLNVRSVAAIGGSAGAPSVILLCRQHPERCASMILVVPAIGPDLQGMSPPPSAIARTAIDIALRSDLLFWASEKVAPRTLIQAILATPRTDFERATLAERERVLSILHDILPISDRAAGLRNDARVTGAAVPYELARIHTPTLILSTENDGFDTAAGARAARRQMPQAQLIVFPDGGHTWIGHQEQMFAAIARFIDRHSRSS